MEHLQRAVPVLASLDIFKTVDFYKDKMGFNKEGWKDKDYAVVGRDNIEIHFWKCNSKKIPKNTSCYVHVRDVDGLYEEMRARGVVHPNGTLANRPWGMREFAVLDGDGNLIKFGERL